MNSAMAFLNGVINRGNERKVFDWNKAATLIKEKLAKNASAGLSGDWGYTGGEIYNNGEIVNDDYTYLASTWATPEIEIDGETFDCYIMESEAPKEWTNDGKDCADIKWPETALAILSK